MKETRKATPSWYLELAANETAFNSIHLDNLHISITRFH